MNLNRLLHLSIGYLLLIGVEYIARSVPKRADSFLMPSLTPLQQLRRLDRLFPQFPDQLTGLLCERKYGDYVTSIQDHDLSWLVEYLDDVRPLVAFTNSLPKLP